VLRGRAAIGDDNFLVHAGDTYIVSERNMHHRRLARAFEETKADAVFLVNKMKDPRDRGIVDGVRIGKGLYSVKRVVEKPKVPFSDLAIEPVYLFRSSIFDSLKETKPGKESELQLTDAIAGLVAIGRIVCASELPPGDFRLDIGGPRSYWEALGRSYNFATRKSKPVSAAK
jgi:dTDP-glucose pyrophosphorylase